MPVQIVTPAKATAVARSAAERLAALVKPDGRFVYRYVFPDPATADAAYGPVRHIAAVWAMLDCEREWNLPHLSAAIDRAAAFMEARLFRPYGGTDALCVLDEGFIKLGGSAMGVAAELGLLARSGRDEHLHLAIRLGRYVASQRQGDGDFVHIRVPGPIAAPHPMRGDLFTGQPLLALALLAEATGETSWLDLALESTDKLARRDHGVGSLAHWMLYALEVLVRVRRERWMLDYARRLAEGMLADDATRQRRESTPLACQSEGLLAYARILSSLGDDGDPAGDILKRVARTLRRQLRFYDPSGAFIHSREKPEVRIDYIMHNMIGFLGYARLAAGDRRPVRSTG